MGHVARVTVGSSVDCAFEVQRERQKPQLSPMGACPRQRTRGDKTPTRVKSRQMGPLFP